MRAEYRWGGPHGPTPASPAPTLAEEAPVYWGEPAEPLRFGGLLTSRVGGYPLLWAALACAVQASLERALGLAVLQSLARARAVDGTARLLSGPDEWAPQLALLEWQDGNLACWRGTSNYSQMARYFLGFVVSEPVGLGGGINLGFSAAGATAAEQLQLALGSPSRPLILSGHSYGAAVAQVVAEIRGGAGAPPLTTLTWGGPRVGTSSWVDRVSSPVVRTEAVGDPVPGLPPDSGILGATYRLTTLDVYRWQGYAHAGYGWGLGENGELFRLHSPGWSPSAIAEALIGLDQGSAVDFGAHAIAEYARRLNLRWYAVEPWYGSGWADPRRITQVLQGED